MKKDIPSFEDFIRGKLSEGEFSFEEQHWTAAQKQISDLRSRDKKRRKRRIAAWFFFGILILGISSYGVWKVLLSPPAIEADEPKPNVSHVSSQTTTDALFTDEKASIQSRQNHTRADVNAGDTVQNNIPSSISKTNTLPHSNGSSLSTTVGKQSRIANDEFQLQPTNTVVEVHHTEKPQQADSISKNESISDDRINGLPVPILLPSFSLSNIAPDDRKDHLIPKPDDLQMRPPSPWRFAASLRYGAGTSLSPTLKNLRSTEANLHVNRQITRLWSASTGIGYTYLSGRIPVGSSVQTTYGFVATTTRYEWGLKNVQLLHFPLELTFTPGSQHEISLGGHAFYRLKTSGNLIIYRSTTIEEETPISIEANVDYGEALPLLNFQGSLNYGYRFNERLTAGAEFRFGLTDLLDDTFFQRTGKDNVTFIGLFLKYNL